MKTMLLELWKTSNGEVTYNSSPHLTKQC